NADIDAAPGLLYADLNAAVALHQHVVPHLRPLGVKALVLRHIAQGIGCRLRLFLVHLRARAGLRIGATLPLKTAQVIDLPLDAVDDLRRLTALLERRQFSRRQLAAVEVVSRLLGLSAAL